MPFYISDLEFVEFSRVPWKILQFKLVKRLDHHSVIGPPPFIGIYSE